MIDMKVKRVRCSRDRAEYVEYQTVQGCYLYALSHAGTAPLVIRAREWIESNKRCLS